MSNASYKRGTVSELLPNGEARVKFEDEDGVTSFKLGVLNKGTMGRKSSSHYKVGSQVACLVDFNGEDGVILGSVYSDVDKAPTTATENDHTTHEDGAVVEHDPVTGVHRIQLPATGKLLLEVAGAKLYFAGGAITSNVRINLGAVPDLPVRGKV